MRLKNIGFITICAYACMFYLPQFLLHVVNEPLLSGHYAGFEDSLLYAGFIPIFFLFVCGLRHWPVEKPIYALLGRRRFDRLFEGKIFLLPIAIVNLVTSIEFFQTQDMGFRFSGVGLKDVGPGITLMFTTKFYVYAWLFYSFILVINRALRKTTTFRLVALIFLVDLVITINSSFDLVFIFMDLILLVMKPERIRSFLVKNEFGKSPSKGINLRKLVFYLILPSVLIGCIVVGFINKMGVEGINFLIRDEGYSGILAGLMLRMSSSYASVISFAAKRLFDLSYYSDIYHTLFDTFLYRFSLVFTPDSPYDRPLIQQIGRLNLLNYANFEVNPEIGGASPGLVGSAFFVAPFPMGFLIMALFVVLFARLLNGTMVYKNSKCSWIVPLLFLTFANSIFESPLDLLVGIDPINFFIFLLFMALIAARRRSSVSSCAGSGIMIHLPNEQR